MSAFLSFVTSVLIALGKAIIYFNVLHAVNLCSSNNYMELLNNTPQFHVMNKLHKILNIF